MAPNSPLRASLDLLARRRAPYAGPLAAIAGDVLARFPPAGDRPVLEIGAARASCAAGCRPRCARASFTASRRTPRRARCAGAPATRPSCAPPRRRCRSRRGRAAPSSACACSTRSPTRRRRPPRSRACCAPGGRFVHLLDMATLLERPFAKLAGSGAGADPERVRRSGRSRVAARHRAARARLAGEPAALRGATPAIRSRRRSRRSSRRSCAGRRSTSTRRDRRVQGDRRQRRAPPDAGRRCCVRQPPVGRARATRPSSRCPFIPAATCRACSTPASPPPASPIELSEIVARAVRRPAADDETALRYRSLCVGHERLETRAAPPPARRRAARRRPPPATSSSRPACSPSSRATASTADPLRCAGERRGTCIRGS